VCCYFVSQNFFSAQLSTTITEFLGDAAAALKFVRNFPDNNTAAFLDALEVHKKLEEEAKARESREEKERLEQMQINAVLNWQDPIQNQNLDICNNHDCCKKLASEIICLNDRISKLENYTKQQDLCLQKLNRYVETEFSKLKPDEERIRQTRNSDEWLEGRWHLPTEWLYNAAIDNRSNACLVFMDKIFGQQELRQYRTFATLPLELKKAAESAIRKFNSFSFAD
jgi:hypothetical protein